MKHLIIYAHPNEKSINFRLKEKVISTLKERQQQVVVRDLYDLNFDPVLSLEDIKGQLQGKVDDTVKQEQEYIQWADVVSFIHPIWWTGLPAIMKGYIDRIMSYGFAYRYDQGVQKGLLSGKKAIIVNTQGKSHAEYNAIGMDRALQLTSDIGIYKYCGFEIDKHLFFEKADRANDETSQTWMEEVGRLYSSLG